MSDFVPTVDQLPEASVTLTGPVSPRLLAGHPWIYRSEIASVAPTAGAAGKRNEVARVSVVDARGKFVGYGVLNPRSMIAVRLFSRQREQPLTRALVQARARRALEARRALLAGVDHEHSACRLIFGEADGLPGLIVDKFGSVLVFQSLAFAAEVCRDDVLATLATELSCTRIVERNDAPVRDLEGLAQRRGEWPAEATAVAGDGLVEILENGCRYLVDPLGGQKTGYYLDQRDNRALVQRLATQIAADLVTGDRSKELAVLDCFSYTGGFAAAALVGAGPALGRLVCVDSSGPALDLARRNLALNSAGTAVVPELVGDNVFDYLRRLDALSGPSRQTFDLIILDPPPFARERRMLEGAVRGYKEINLRAIKLLRPGGFLVTSTCSHYVSRELLQQICVDAAADARRTLRLVTATVQPADHPVLLGHPEGDYLRCLVLQDVGQVV